MTYQETIDYLFSQLPSYERQGAGGYKPGLQTSRDLDDLFGNPHKKYRCIHVAGTNGKGSVSSMIAAVLQKDVSYDPALFAKPSEDPAFRPKAPGQKYKHYSPNAEVVIYEGSPEDVAAAVEQRRLEEESKGRKVGTIDVPQPRSFFAQLRGFDAQGLDIILVAGTR